MRGDVDGAAAKEDENNGALRRRRDGRDELILRSRHREHRAIVPFALLALVEASDDNRGLRTLRSGDGGGDAARVRAADRRDAGHRRDGDALRTDTSGDCDFVRRRALVVPEQYCAVVRERTDYGDRLDSRRVERQRRCRVLEQHDAKNTAQKSE